VKEIKIVSWNIAGWTGKRSLQVKALSDLNPDVVALQEVPASGWELYRHELVGIGLPYVEYSHNDLNSAASLKHGVLIASRFPLKRLPPGTANVPWPECVLSVLIKVAGKDLELHSAHVPNGRDYKWKKIETAEGLGGVFSTKSKRPGILCGDFNTPQAELEDGTVITWAYKERRDGTFRFRKKMNHGTGERWHAGEHGLLRPAGGGIDVFRALHGYSVREYSWFNRNGVGRRFDHFICSLELNPTSCRYIHELRLQGLSDHSPIEACFELLIENNRTER
jgi:exonuclease III